MVKTSTNKCEFVPSILASNEQSLINTVIFTNLSFCCDFSMHLYS